LWNPRLREAATTLGVMPESVSDNTVKHWKLSLNLNQKLKKKY